MARKPRTYTALTVIELPYDGRILREGDEVDEAELEAHGQGPEQVAQLVEHGALEPA